jgi:DNA-binding transcriptional ArsR family regulator
MQQSAPYLATACCPYPARRKAAKDTASFAKKTYFVLLNTNVVFLLQYATKCVNVTMLHFLCKNFYLGRYFMLMATANVLQDLEYYLPDKQSTKKIARFFAVFSDCSRLRLLSALAISPLCVTDVAKILDMNQTTVSHQLRFLKSAGIVRASRVGKIIFYSLTNESINDVLLKGIEFLGA